MGWVKCSWMEWKLPNNGCQIINRTSQQQTSGTYSWHTLSVFFFSSPAEVCFAFQNISPDIVLNGWLGSKHQLTEFPEHGHVIHPFLLQMHLTESLLLPLNRSFQQLRFVVSKLMTGHAPPTFSGVGECSVNWKSRLAGCVSLLLCSGLDVCSITMRLARHKPGV